MVTAALNPENARIASTSVLGVVGKWDKSGVVAVVGQVLIFAIFALFDNLFVATNFKCPCIDPTPGEDMAVSCGKSKSYSIWFIILTTILAAFLGTAALVGLSQKFAKPMKKNETNTESSTAAETTANVAGATDDTAGPRPQPSPTPAQTSATNDNIELEDISLQMTPRTDSGRTEPDNASEIPQRVICTHTRCSTLEFFLGVGQFLVVAAAWLSILCIDGDYIACASTCNPYGNTNCSEIRETPYDELPFSKEYVQIQRNVSQPIGIGLAIGVAVLILVFLGVKCNEYEKKKDWKCNYWLKCDKWKLCSDEEQGIKDPREKIDEAKQLLSETRTNAYIVQNL